jgi:hypothetical protein
VALPEEAVTVLFCRVDDGYYRINPQGRRYETLTEISDSEVVTLALFQQLRGVESERSFLREAAHIRPLGAPHNGPDTLDNTLCLCPNHHVLFDHGGTRSTKIYLSSVSRAGSQFIRATASTIVICATAGSTTKLILELQTL